MKDDKKVLWINGLRGIVCIMIFVYFFLRIFYPAIHSGDGDVSHSPTGFDVSLSQSVFSGFINGDYLTSIFCLLIGLTLSYQIFASEKKESISDVMIKRYFRLALPVFAVSLIIYIMVKHMEYFNIDVSFATRYSLPFGYYEDIENLGQVFMTSFITDWFKGDSTFSAGFWVLKYVLLGSFLTYILGMLSWGKNKKIIIIYVFAALIYFIIDSYFLCFVLGTIIAYIIANFEKPKFSNIIGVIMILLGYFFGGYPTAVTPNNIYSSLNHLPEWITTYQFYHIIGAGLFVMGIYYLDIISKFFGFGVFRFMGTISYGVYLASVPLIFSLSMSMFIKFYEKSENYNSAVWTSFIISLIVLILISFVFHHTIERLSNFVTNKLVKFIT